MQHIGASRSLTANKQLSFSKIGHCK